MIRYFLIIFFIIFSASAEVVVTEGTYTYTGEISKNEARAEYIKSIEPFKTKNGYEIPGEFVIGTAIKE
jgi:hypothetical protein